MLQIIQRPLLTGGLETEYLEVPSPEKVAAEVERIEFERNSWARKRYAAFANYDVDTLTFDDEPGHIVPDHEPVEEYL
jgi:hypothetical protein